MHRLFAFLAIQTSRTPFSEHKLRVNQIPINQSQIKHRIITKSNRRLNCSYINSPKDLSQKINAITRNRPILIQQLD